MRRYVCKYQYSRQYGMPTHTWSALGAAGAVHLYIRDSGDLTGPDLRYHGGFEIHRRTSPDGRAPDYDNCWLLHANCWHDGSSLVATERCIPFWLTDPHDHERMFRALEDSADEVFAKDAVSDD